MSFQKIIDKGLELEQYSRKDRIRSGRFSCSNFGRCYRMQFWDRKNEKQTNPPSTESLRRFKIGNLIHQYMQQFFPNGQKEVKMLIEDDVIGFADIVLDNEVVDIKSCRTYEFKTFFKKDYDIRIGKNTNCMQVCAYALFLGKPFARLIFIEKDALDSKEFILETKDFKKDIEEELEILRGYWKNDKLPAPLPRAYGGKEGKYCSYQLKCLEMGFDCINRKNIEIIIKEDKNGITSK